MQECFNTSLDGRVLRVLQEKEIVRVGDTQPVKVDFRAIAATNKSLEKLVDERLFRPVGMVDTAFWVPPAKMPRLAQPLAVDPVTGNAIHDIHVHRLFSGAEMAGIKFHGAIDVEISHNHIYRTVRGIWRACLAAMAPRSASGRMTSESMWRSPSGFGSSEPISGSRPPGR